MTAFIAASLPALLEKSAVTLLLIFLLDLLLYCRGLLLLASIHLPNSVRYTFMPLAEQLLLTRPLHLLASAMHLPSHISQSLRFHPSCTSIYIHITCTYACSVYVLVSRSESMSHSSDTWNSALNLASPDLLSQVLFFALHWFNYHG